MELFGRGIRSIYHLGKAEAGPATSAGTRLILDCLTSMGVQARIVDPDGPESLKYLFPGGVVYHPSGLIRIEGRSIDFVDVWPTRAEDDPPDLWHFSYGYTVRVTVGERNDDLSAKIIDFESKGSLLAGLLNSDLELGELLRKAGLKRVLVQAFRNWDHVDISVSPTFPGRWVRETVLLAARERPPTREIFEAVDRIAMRIHEAAATFQQEEQDSGRAEEEKKKEEEQASDWLPTAILALLEQKDRGLTSKEIGDELRAPTAPSFQNLQLIKVLLRLMEEGKVTRTQGKDKVLRYFKK